MSKKSNVILLQVVKALESIGWKPDVQWQLSLKADGHIPLMHSVIAHGSLNDSEWTDDVQTLIRLRVTTDDEITFFTEFSVYAQIAIGSISSQEIDYQMMGNQAFTEKDVKDTKKAILAAKEIGKTKF
jgi:hypothetical protein